MYLYILLFYSPSWACNTKILTHISFLGFPYLCSLVTKSFESHPSFLTLFVTSLNVKVDLEVNSTSKKYQRQKKKKGWRVSVSPLVVTLPIFYLLCSIPFLLQWTMDLLGFVLKRVKWGYLYNMFTICQSGSQWNWSIPQNGRGLYKKMGCRDKVSLVLRTSEIFLQH